MASFFDNVLRWQATAGETHALLSRNSELLTDRVELLHTALYEFRHVLRLTRQFTDEASAGQDPAARSTSPRSR